MPTSVDCLGLGMSGEQLFKMKGTTRENTVFNADPKKFRNRRERLDDLVARKGAFKGTIVAFNSNWRSGVVTLMMQDAKGNMWPVYGTVGPTLHLLDKVFGGVLPGDPERNDHLETSPFIGHEVYYEVDEKDGNLVSLIETNDPELDE